MKKRIRNRNEKYRHDMEGGARDGTGIRELSVSWL